MSQRPFPESRKNKRGGRTKKDSAEAAGESRGAVGKYFADRGVRETIESVIVAVMLALLFRAFEAEAFVIPTGSMAPTLMGRHKDVECEKCGYRYRTGASDENEDRPIDAQGFVAETACPICHYSMLLDPESDANQESFSGDRILVDKFAYAFSPPQRWDVIVFKYPGNPKQNYIKRLLGLPGEVLMVRGGDIYVAAANSDQFHIQSKDPRKLRAMLQLVDDTHFVAEQLNEVGWPSRWNEWGTADESQRAWKVADQGEHPVYSVASNDETTSWLRYRHLAPHPLEWLWDINKGRIPARIADSKGALISDFYAYNDGVADKDPESYRRKSMSRREDWEDEDLSQAALENEYKNWMRIRGLRQGLHWVGDLAVEFEVDVEKADGTMTLDLVEGGVHFYCTVNLKNGETELTSDDPKIRFVGKNGDELDSLSTKTAISGPGTYRIRYANCDDRIYLWVNNNPVAFNGRGDYLRDDLVVPTWSSTDAGDAEPIGIGFAKATAKVTRARVLRDIYYTQGRPDGVDYRLSQVLIDNKLRNVDVMLIESLMNSPDQWAKGGDSLFGSVYEDNRVFRLDDNQLFPMGDNSPASADARSWGWREKYIESDDLVGKALFVYWPHSWNRPIPYFPNFRRMGFIR